MFFSSPVFRRWLWTSIQHQWLAKIWAAMTCSLGSMNLYRSTSPRLSFYAQVRWISILMFVSDVEAKPSLINAGRKAFRSCSLSSFTCGDALWAELSPALHRQFRFPVPFSVSNAPVYFTALPVEQWFWNMLKNGSFADTRWLFFFCLPKVRPTASSWTCCSPAAYLWRKSNSVPN